MPTTPILLGAAALPSLRSGLYTKLEDATEALTEALAMCPRSLEQHPWTATNQLRAVAGMLDRTGWAEPGDPPGIPAKEHAIQLASAPEAVLAIEALQEMLAIKRHQAEDLHPEDDHQRLLEAQHAISRLQRLLASLEMMANTAGVRRP